MDFQKYEADPRLKLCAEILTAVMTDNIREMADAYDFDVAFAVMATALGTTAGDFQATFNRHQGECDKCAKKQWDIYQLVVKNFGAAFGHEKREVERIHSDAIAAADNALDAILRKHKP